jgi:thiamine transport system permease protein
LIRSSVLAATGIVFLFCFTTYGAARVLAGPRRPTVETEIYRYAVLVGDLPRASALAIAQVCMVGIVLVLTSQRSVRVAHQPQYRLLQDLRRPIRLATYVGLGALTFAVLLPLAGVVLSSLRPSGTFSLSSWRAAFTGSSDGANAVDAIIASFKIALVATLLALCLGVMVAAVQSYASSPLLRHTATVVTATPVVISAVVLGLGFILAFRTQPIDWRGSWWLLPVAHAMVALPLVSRALTPAVQQIPNGYRDAASLLGASPWRVWRDIDIALIRRPLAGAASLAATISLGEFGASSLLSRRGDETVTMTMGRLLGKPGDIAQGQVFVLATILAATCIVLTVVVDATSSNDTTVNKAVNKAVQP